jgi:hypothetical protein
MSMMEHPSFQGRLDRAETEPAKQADTPEPATDYKPARRYADRACCCPASPAIIAVIPPADGRQTATDLLLCVHHYRMSRAALAAIGATLLDISGHPLTAEEWPVPAIC